MSTVRDERACRELETLSARLFDTEDAVAMLSGTAAMLVLACCLGRPGTRALLPGWICSSVYHVLILAGMQPVPLDIETDFTISLHHADHVYTSDTSLFIYAPFGGHASDFDACVTWAAERHLALIADLVPSPDPDLWRRVSAQVPAVLTSFRPGKPLGAAGGGIIAGRAPVVEAGRTFLNSGRDHAGQKVSLGMELPLSADAADMAKNQLALQPQRIVDWRDLTRQKLHEEEARCLPGWSESPYGLSKIPRLQGSGRRLNSNATYRSSGWRQAASARFGTLDEEPLRTLEVLYDRIVVTSINPF